MLLLLSSFIFFSCSAAAAAALLLAHSKAISVFPVPVLYIIDPLHLLENHASIALC